MPYTEAQLQAMKDALASGVRRVRYADREVEYRSSEELRADIAAVEAELNATVGTPNDRHVRIHTGKGL
jgi:hypothetical protein